MRTRADIEMQIYKNNDVRVTFNTCLDKDFVLEHDSYECIKEIRHRIGVRAMQFSSQFSDAFKEYREKILKEEKHEQS